MTPSSIRARSALTLVEALVVLAIVAVLLGLVLAGVQQARATAAGLKCANNLRQVGLACHYCNDAHQRLPSAWNWFPSFTIHNGSAGIGPLFFHLLRFLDEEALYLSARYTVAKPPQDYFDYSRAISDRHIGFYKQSPACLGGFTVGVGRQPR